MSGNRKQATVVVAIAVIFGGWLGSVSYDSCQPDGGKGPRTAGAERLRLSFNAGQSSARRPSQHPEIISKKGTDAPSRTKGESASKSPRTEVILGGARLAEAGTLHPRRPEEWQGWRVTNSTHLMAECDRSDRCGLALACTRGRCGACVQDEDCAAGERCALDHCLLAEHMKCATRRDCSEGDFCILDDEGSTGPRYNNRLYSSCWRRGQAKPQPAEMPDVLRLPPKLPSDRPPVDVEQMLADLHNE